MMVSFLFLGLSIGFFVLCLFSWHQQALREHKRKHYSANRFNVKKSVFLLLSALSLLCVVISYVGQL